MPTPVVRPALRYFGAKWRLAPWIIDHLPPHICYCEPFGGSGAVLLRKPPATYEVYNDLDGDVVNFFRVLREQPDMLIRAIDLTPYAREEYRQAVEPTDDPVERARRLYVRMWMERGSRRHHARNGWRFQRRAGHGKDAVGEWDATDHLLAVAARLKRVQIERDDALRVIRRFDAATTLFYVDPPYVAATRGPRWSQRAYLHEMTDDDHRALADVLNHVAGMVALSGYDGDLYRDLYAGWERVSTRTQTDAHADATETLWLNAAAVKCGRQMRLEGVA